MKISLQPNSKVVMEKRYLKKDSCGNIIETPEELFARVAKSIAAADTIYRYGSRENQVLNTGIKRRESVKIAPRSRSRRTQGIT